MANWEKYFQLILQSINIPYKVLLEINETKKIDNGNA